MTDDKFRKSAKIYKLCAALWLFSAVCWMITAALSGDYGTKLAMFGMSIAFSGLFYNMGVSAGKKAEDGSQETGDR